MANWNLDQAHSELEFKVRHMMISTVKGQFTKFDINLSNESEDLASAKINVSIDVASIDTKNQQRDEHLKSADFFDASTYSTIKFESTEISNKSGSYTVSGNLTIKDITKVVSFDVEFGGVAKDPWGNDKYGFTVVGSINRSDFGLNWNAALETGGVMVSEEVKFNAELQFTKS